MAPKTKYTKEMLLQKFAEVNHNAYQYDVSNYINTRSKIDIKCSIHGWFSQRVSNHLRGQGCKSCASSVPTKELHELLSEFKDKHGSRYSYEKIVFRGMQEKIDIICSEHGTFSQRPHDHRNGRGCPSCVGRGIKEIISVASTIHCSKYNYDEAILIKRDREKWLCRILCSIHGFIDITVANHLAGHGCKKCGYSNKQPTTIQERIRQANLVHGDTYHYPLTDHTRSHDKVPITCKIHGEFLQTWANHIYMKQGCRLCNRVSGRYTEDYFITYPERKNVKSCLYVIKMNDNGTIFYKIGITKDYKNRMKRIPYKKEEVIIIDGSLYEMFTKEQHFLKNFGYKNRFTPSIKFGGDKECFILSVEEILEHLV